MSRPGVAVVVATRDRAQRLESLLDSLQAQILGRFEVIVVDDGSVDSTPELLAAYRPRPGVELQVLRNDAARGPAHARNAGWSRARAPLVAFTDDDCVAGPGWLEAGLHAWRGDPLRFVQGRTDPIPEELHRLGPFSRTLRIGSLGPWYQTCNVFYPRDLLERVGGFAATAFSLPTAEDADLAWRCFDAGAHARFAADAQVFHAVHELGPLGLLRVAWRWHELVHLFARHPGRRAVLTYGLFWKKTHYLMARAALGLVLRRPRALRFWCLAPIAPAYLHRARVDGGRRWLAPYFLLHDVVETIAIVRGAIRTRTPII